MTREEKSQAIDALVEILNNNEKIYLADCSSLTVEKTNTFRRSCYDKNISIQVVKNTLLEKAIEKANNTDLVGLIPVLKGATALITTEVGAAPAKLIKEFRNAGNSKPLLKGAYVEQTIYLGDEQLDALAAIKSKNELIADVVALLQSPAKRVLSALQNHSEKKEAA